MRELVFWDTVLSYAYPDFSDCEFTMTKSWDYCKVERTKDKDKQEVHSPPEWLSSQRAGQIPQVSLFAGFALCSGEDNNREQ